jgi:quercetin dioxygenase-like cupin family protein
LPNDEPEVTRKDRVGLIVLVVLVERIFLWEEVMGRSSQHRKGILLAGLVRMRGASARLGRSSSMTGIRHVRLDRSKGAPSSNPIFVGSVSIQEVVNDALADLLRVTAVTFENGAVNRPHRHTTDQVLVATSGSGFVATDEERYPLEPGDVAFIASGTRHWHGANPNATFTHLSILTPGHTEIDDEQSHQ